MSIKVLFSDSTPFQGYKNTKGKVPFVEKPLTYNNLMFAEPPRYNEDYSFDLFGSLFKMLKKEEKKTVSESTYEPTYTPSYETKVETTYTPKVETTYTPKVETSYISETTTKKATKYTSHTTKAKSSTVKEILSKTADVSAEAAIGIAKVIAIPIALSIKGIKLLGEKISEIKRSHDIKKAQTKYLLKDLQKVFKRDLKKYKNSFDAEDMKPSFAKFDAFESLSYKNLKNLHNVLSYDIKRQQSINKAKELYKRGADGYNGPNGGCNGFEYLFDDITPRKEEYYECNRYKNELERLCKIYIKNSKQFEKPLNNFNKISTNYFAITSKHLQEIYDIQNDKIIKILERIPKIGIIPKALRVYEQWNLANIITKDFKAVTDKHVYNGIHPIALEYDNQYKTIVDFANNHKNKFSKNNKRFTEEMLKLIQKSHNEREKVYSKLYDRFITGGCNIKKICKKTKTKGGASLAKKAIFTMMPFIC